MSPNTCSVSKPQNIVPTKICNMKLGGISFDYHCTTFSTIWWPESRYSKEEEWEFDHLTEISKFESECLLTFGEWVGPIAMFWLNYFPDRYVVALEPDPTAFSRLFSNLLGYEDRVRLHNLCVNIDGENTKIQTSGNSGSKINKGDYRVQCVPIEELYRLYSHCAWKMDIEGYEEFLLPIMVEKKIFLKEISFSVHKKYIKNWSKFHNLLEEYMKEYAYIKKLDMKDDLTYPEFNEIIMKV